MESLINHLQNFYHSGYFSGLWTLLGGSAAITIVLTFIRHNFDHGWGKRVIVSLLAILSALGTLASMLLSANPQSLKVFGDHTALVIGIATIVYHFVTSPVYKSKVLPFLDDVASVKAQRQTKPDSTAASTATNVPTDGVFKP